MSLDSRYVLAPNLQTYFVDKDTGLPLSGGIITFYKDQARTIKKPIYQLTGSPPNYSYSVLSNPIILSSIGTIVDAFGNNILPYFFPYDDSGNLELYYITVQSAGLVDQFTIQGFPNVSASSNAVDITTKNFLPNGQFLAHYIITAESFSPFIPEGQVVDATTIIADGGWTYWKNSPVISTDTISFIDFGGDVASPTSSPRYATRITCISPQPSDTKKWFGISFSDVNKFSSSAVSPQYYTLSFTGKTNTGPVNVDVVLYKYFGVGGASPTTRTLNTSPITLSSSYQIFNTSFTFGDNIGVSIVGDGELELAISLPATYSFDVSLTDFVLVAGKDVNITQFPVETDREFLYKSITPAKPDVGGMDLGCPLILTKSGLIYDRSHVGQIFTYPDLAPIDNHYLLFCDGTTYEAAAYNATTGIPYKRLADYLISCSGFFGAGIYGTGAGQVICAFDTPTTVMWLSGSSTIPTYNQPNAHDGTPATTFTFADDPTKYVNHKTTRITCKTGALTPDGSCFIYTDSSANIHVVWYRKVVGTVRPTVSAAYRYHVVDILSTDDLSTVTKKTVWAINGAYFAVPDLRGIFLRGEDAGSLRDPDRLTRDSPFAYETNWFGGNVPGSRQSYAIQSHQHTYNEVSSVGNNVASGPNYAVLEKSSLTGSTGSNETRPLNVYVNYYIGY